MCVYLQEEPRTQLAPFEGKEIVFQAYFVRFGNMTPEVDNMESVTILLKNPYTYENGEYVRLGHHIWTPYPSGIENLGALFATCRDMQKSPKIRHFRTINKNTFTLFFAKFLHP